jgi:capsule polysaccharide modification protein KpsS
MAKRAMAGVKLTRLEARTRVIQGAGRLAFVAFCMAIGFVVVATAFPQRRALEKLEAKLELAKQREATVLADREYRQIEHRALREDPAFLEIHARDRLNYYREGERVLKFKPNP